MLLGSKYINAILKIFSKCHYSPPLSMLQIYKLIKNVFSQTSMSFFFSETYSTLTSFLNRLGLSKLLDYWEMLLF